MLWSLNGLRASGALLVMLYHVNSWDLQVIRGSSAGFTGVGLFFVLSGFVLTWTARPGTTLGTFYRRRLARIVPNHLVAFGLGILVTLTVLGTSLDPVAVLSGVFLVQAWSPDGDVVFAVNGVSWSLSCEIAFYLAFPFLLWGLRRLRAGTRAVVAVAALVTPAVIGTLWPTLIPLLFHLPPSRLPEFGLGMVTAMAVQEGWRPRVPAPVLLAALAVGILAAARFDLSPVILTAVLAAIFAPLAARCAWGDVDGRNRWARHPVVMIGGALSFAFYLVHELVIKVLVVTPVRGLITIPLVTVVSAALAYCLYRGVEIPARRRMLAMARPLPLLSAAARSRTQGGPRHGRPRTATWSAPAPAPAPGVRRRMHAVGPAPEPVAAIAGPAPMPDGTSAVLGVATAAMSTAAHEGAARAAHEQAVGPGHERGARPTGTGTVDQTRHVGRVDHVEAVEAVERVMPTEVGADAGR